MFGWNDATDACSRPTEQWSASFLSQSSSLCARSFSISGPFSSVAAFFSARPLNVHRWASDHQSVPVKAGRRTARSSGWLMSEDRDAGRVRCQSAPIVRLIRASGRVRFISVNESTSCAVVDAMEARHAGASLARVVQARPKKLWNFEARACIGLQKNLDFINKNVRLD